LATRKLRKLFTPVKIRRGLEENLWLVGSRATTGIENDPGVSQLVVAGILGLDHVPAKDSDVEVLRFLLISHGEEVRDEPPREMELFIGIFFPRSRLAQSRKGNGDLTSEAGVGNKQSDVGLQTRSAA
jgi:hypothetical protein